MKQVLLAHQTTVGVVGCLVALGVAGVYFVVVPEEAADASMVAQLVLRYGHSLCWVLLAAASFTFAVRGSSKLVAGFAYAALGLYAIFMLTFLITKL